MRQVGDYPLWIGTARDARDAKAIHAAGVRAVVDLAAEEPPAALTRDLVYLRFPLVDGDGNEPKVVRAALAAVTALLRERVPTLVACGMGMSRSPAVAAVAFATAYGLNAADVLKSVPGPGDVSPTLLRELQAFAGA
jgi:protein-tyrosine phosphatase